jgi:acyl-lipid omega-6 desaturase (Delta-12 desaturase)
VNKTSRKQLMTLLTPHIQVSTWRGLSLFAIDLIAYLACIAGALFLPYLWLQITASVCAGIMISNLLTLAHDAAHGSLVRNRKLNFVLGIIGLMPGWFSYRMWVYDHHVMHHAHTNGEHKDTYTPFSKQDFDALPKWRQWAERFYRRINPVSFATYYIVERWSRTKLFPNRKLPANVRRSAYKHFALVIAVNTSIAIALWNAPLYSHNSAFMGLLLGMLLPFCSFMATISFFLWAMHTHPRIAWYRGALSDTDRDRDIELVTVHLIMPRWFAAFGHNVLDHPVHHLCPAIPCYRLRAAQLIYNAFMGESAIVAKGTLSYFLDTMRRCKLYDFDNNQWLDFDGVPTTTAKPHSQSRGGLPRAA